MKKFKLFKTLLVLMVLISSINTVLADQHVWNAWVKCDFNGSGKWTTDDGWQFNPTMSTGTLEDLGTLTSGKFTITSLKWKCAHDWGTWPTKAYAYMWYKINDGEAQHSSGQYYGNPGTEFYPYSGTIAWDIANYTDPSGSYTFTCGFYCHFHWNDDGYNNDNLDNGGNNYKFTYKVAPPAVDSYTIDPTGDLDGSGTSEDPYIVAYNGSLTLDLSDADQAHTDANSSAQYSVDGTNYGTTSSYTSTTINNITGSGSVTVYAKFYNSTASLSGEVNAQTIYYQAEARHNVSVSTDGNGTVSPSGTVAVNELSGTSISATPSDNYVFDHWTATGGGVSPTNSTTNPQTFTATGTSGTITAHFADEWNIKGSWDKWKDYQGMPYAGSTNTFSTTLSLAASTTYNFKVVHRGADDVYYGKSSTTFTRGGTTSVTGLTTDGGDTYDLHLTTDIAEDYIITYVYNSNTSSMQVSVTFPTPTYTITYKDKDNAAFSGVHEDGYPTSHTYGFATALDSPTKTGYVFEGWHTESDCESGKVTSLGATTYTADITLYAKWTDAATVAASAWEYDDEKEEYTWAGPASGFDTPQPGATTWSGATWHGSPDINTQVVLTEDMNIDEVALAKEIVLGSGAKLNVEAGGALILGGSVNVGGSATTKDDLILSSDGTNGSAALISSEENTGTAATVEFYTKATYNSAAEVGAQYVNQYFGIPFDEVEADIYDETEYVYEYNVNENRWDPVNIYGTMTAFTAYNILRTSTTAGAMSKSGTLNLPGTTTHKDQVLNLTRLAADVEASKNTTNMFANSWTAPINIASMVTVVDETKTTPEFVGVDPTIYIFNAGTYADKDNVGQWISLPVKSVYDNPGSYALNVIPSQQAFLVYATGTVGATHTLTLDYKKHVYDPAKAAADAGEDIGIAPAKAPKRTTATNNNFMAVNVSGESGFGDRVMIFTDKDFSEGFDSGWDGRKLSGKGYTPQLYALTSDGEMAVNSVPTAEGTVLGFKRGSQDTNYTISFEYNGNEEWYLNDTEEQTSTLINAENTYEFTATSDADAARFVISKTPIKKVPTGISNINEGVNARKLIIDGQLYIIRDGRIYNAEGAVVK